MGFARWDLCGNADDAAGRAGAGVARLLALLVPALSEVVGARVADEGALQGEEKAIVSPWLLTAYGNTGGVSTYSENAVLADQLDEAVADAALGVALGIRLDVSKVTDVAFAVGGSAVCLAVRVVCGVERYQSASVLPLAIIPLPSCAL